MTAYLLQHRFRAPVDITLFEASNRLGGKVMTRRFDHAGAIYEAGAAELYDYSAIGPDPLRELVAELGLSTYPMHGSAVFLGDQMLRSEEDLAHTAGPRSLQNFRAFLHKARNLISPTDYYESDWRQDNGDPLARQSFESLLAGIGDEAVRRYIEVSIHSDLATEPRHTSAAYGLQNFLMNEPEYMSLYGIHGGIEQITAQLGRRIHATIHLESPVRSVEPLADDTYRVAWRHRGRDAWADFDFVVVALPNGWIPSIQWLGATLAPAMREHHAHYDHPAHYLRVTLLYREPFWRKTIADSYFMTDALGGCCIYNEGARCADQTMGVLGWLIAGEAALALNNLPDNALINHVLDAAPASIRQGRDLFLEGRVHRWTGSVNALPGGYPLREPDSRHQPDPQGNPGLFVVGDYLFDSTLNGVLDSAECVAEWINEETIEEPSVTLPDPEPARQRA